MSVLAILMPARVRLSARDDTLGDGRSAVAQEELAWVLSNDGHGIDAQGRCAAPLLPKADSVVLALHDADVGWHRITVPKVPLAKLRPALVGMLEEQLLEDVTQVHLALGPGAMGGHSAWVAAVNAPWLASALAKLDSAGVMVDAVVPLSAPGDQLHGHFYESAADAAGSAHTMLCLSTPEGLHSTRLAGSLAKAWAPRLLEQPVRWTASPAVAAPAERWLGAPLSVLTDAERAVVAARSPWNLRQFDLALRNRGLRTLRTAGRQFMRPSWKPVRIGLSALLVFQLVGLNAWAWHQNRQVQAKRDAMVALLKTAHPQVKTVMDAPAQMQRETEVLRTRAGRTNEADFEALLAHAATAWPEGTGPSPTLRYDNGKLSLGATGWGEPQVNSFREQLRLAGVGVEHAEGRLTLSRLPARKASP